MVKPTASILLSNMLHRTIVSAVIFSADNCILFGRKDPQHGGVYLDKWHIPGGGVEKGEQNIDALKRELWEETGLQVEDQQITPLDELGEMLTLKKLASGEKIPCEMNFFVYKVQLDVPAAEITALAGDDFSEVKWIPLKAVANYPLTPPSISLFLRLGWLSSEQALQQRTFRNADEEIVEYDQSQLSWRVSVYALVVQAGSVLVIKNKKEKLYDVIGGGVEFGETVEDALAREAMEEGGAKVQVKELIHTKVDWFYHKKQKRFYQTMQMFYRAELIGTLQSPTDSDTEWVGFVSLAEVSKKYQLPVTVQLALAKLDD